MKTFGTVALALLLPALVVAGKDDEKKSATPQKAVAVLHGLGGSHVMGTITFTQHDGYIEISGEISGLTPGDHAFHVHEFGDCSDPKGMSAGGHFNPQGHQHGAPDSDMRHVGDLGNIKADDEGKVTLKLEDKVIQLHGPHSIIGRSLIIHEKRDDFGQPVGNAGGRVACAVIGIAKP
jgi:superoxide dismutase, Cu-Zn family